MLVVEVLRDEREDGDARRNGGLLAEQMLSAGEHDRVDEMQSHE